MDADFKNDLRLDERQIYEIMSNMDQEFGIVLDFDDIDEFTSVRHSVDYLVAYLQHKIKKEE